MLRIFSLAFVQKFTKEYESIKIGGQLNKQREIGGNWKGLKTALKNKNILKN